MKTQLLSLMQDIDLERPQVFGRQRIEFKMRLFQLGRKIPDHPAKMLKKKAAELNR